MHELFITFTYKEHLILVLVNFTDEEIRLFVSQLIRLSPQEAKAQDMRMGISANQMGISNQKANFEKALSAMEMAKTRKEPCCYYDKLGIYKVLYAVGDKIVLRDFCKDMLGKLESYDRENDTQLALMLQTYLDSNGSMQAVSEKQFVHRNTVTNQLKKIEDITGYNPFDLKDKVKLCLAFYIKDILYNSDVQLHNEL
jgi:DNA-binding PucR family transcriptional regulator